MKDYRLPRTGDTTLVFAGELVTSSSGNMHAGQNQNRYHDVTVYRTTGGKYVLQIEYITHWQGEDGRDTVHVRDDIPALVKTLQNYDPTEFLIGYPPGGQFADKQARICISLEDRWSRQVSEILDALGAEERID